MAIYAKQMRNNLKNGRYDSRLRVLYGKEDTDRQRKRYLETVASFLRFFGDRPVQIYSAPGRTELIGNHLDHQHGSVIAAAVNADIIAVVSPNNNTRVRIKSKRCPVVSLDIFSTEPEQKEKGTSHGLIRGMADGVRKAFGLQELYGFDAYLDSQVPTGSGMSSSAAFEILIGNIFSGLHQTGDAGLYETAQSAGIYNRKFSNVRGQDLSEAREQERSFAVMLAKCGQQAENRYFGKPSGLMDQIACSVGGTLYIDFKEPFAPETETLDFDPCRSGYRLALVNTGGSHAKLTGEYAQIPEEMKRVASFFGKTVLREVPEYDFYKAVPELRKQAGDRAVLRAVHFFEEQRRVLAAKDTLLTAAPEVFFRMLRASGDSSWKYLQNIYPSGRKKEQQMALALALSEKLLGSSGVFRVHGGGFAGMIQVFVPLEKAEPYKAGMEAVFGVSSCRFFQIRKIGGCRVI